MYPEFEDFIDEKEEDRLEGIKMYGFLLVVIWYKLIFGQSQGKRKGCSQEEENGGR